MNIMMVRKFCLFIILNIIVHLSLADDKCDIPETPAVPVGSSVTEEKLLLAISELKGYQAEMENFRNCLDSKKIVLDEESMDEATLEKSRNINVALDAVYNGSVEKEQAVADRLNTEIRRFKSNQKYKDR